MQNQRTKIDIENKELKILLNLIPRLTFRLNGILLQRN